MSDQTSLFGVSRTEAPPASRLTRPAATSPAAAPKPAAGAFPRKASAETRAKMAETQRRRWAEQPDLRERVAAKIRSRPLTERQRAALDANCLKGRGLKHTEATRAKIAEALRQRHQRAPMGAEMRAHLAALMRERIASGVIDNRGKHRPDETRARLGRARRATVAKQRAAAAMDAEIARGRAAAGAARQAFLARMARS